jgi:hypothetical protein
MNNVFPQYQIETSRDGKNWEMVFFDPDLPIMRLRLESLRLRTVEGTKIRLLGLKGEHIETVEGIALDKPKKKTIVEE